MDGNAFVGRQPICKERAEVVGYELLCRESELGQTAFKDGDAAAARRLVEKFVDIGLNKVVGQDRAFISVTPDFLRSGFCSSLPNDRVVLQIPTTIVEEPVMDSVARLSKAGYSIALDNFVDSGRIAPLAESADIAKIDIRAVNREAVERQYVALRRFNMKLLAEAVETREEYEFCKKLGFDYYQGFFFCKPDVATYKKIPFNRLSTLHLLSRLQNPNISPQELEHAVGQNLAITYKVLRYLNSAAHSFPRKIESIRHAVTLAGTRLLSNWASLALIESIEDKPRELMVTAVIRAHMCQQLGVAMRQTNTDRFFTVGLLSVIDAILDRPMREALHVLPLAHEVNDALLERKGLMGEALKCIEAYERGDWERTVCGNLDENTIREAYLSSVMSTRGVTQEFIS